MRGQTARENSANTARKRLERIFRSPMEQLEVRRSFGGVRTALVVLIMGVSAEVRLGGLFQHTATKVGRFVAFLMAVEEINNSTDLLPGNALR